MKFKYIINYLGFGLMVFSYGCSDYIDNARIFVEGKVTTQNGEGVSLPLKINSKFLISEVTSKSDGTFSLGGAATVDTANLYIGRKIISFSANVSGCKINYDSLSIKLPSGQGATKFNNIILE